MPVEAFEDRFRTAAELADGPEDGLQLLLGQVGGPACVLAERDLAAKVLAQGCGVAHCWLRLGHLRPPPPQGSLSAAWSPQGEYRWGVTTPRRPPREEPRGHE